MDRAELPGRGMEEMLLSPREEEDVTGALLEVLLTVWTLFKPEAASVVSKTWPMLLVTLLARLSASSGSTLALVLLL